jgi:uncharacterized membrane protein (DUF4010 family)
MSRLKVNILRVAATLAACLIFTIGEFVVYPIIYPECFHTLVGFDRPFQNQPCIDVSQRMWISLVVFTIVVAISSARFIRARAKLP